MTVPDSAHATVLQSSNQAAAVERTHGLVSITWLSCCRGQAADGSRNLGQNCSYMTGMLEPARIIFDAPQLAMSVSVLALEQALV
jgi:hypothetical protein